MGTVSPSRAFLESMLQVIEPFDSFRVGGLRKTVLFATICSAPVGTEQGWQGREFSFCALVYILRNSLQTSKSISCILLEDSGNGSWYLSLGTVLFRPTTIARYRIPKPDFSCLRESVE